MLIGIIGWIVLGLIIGVIATRFVNLRNDDPRVGIVVGVVAAVLCGWLYSLISGAGVTRFNLWSLVVAGVGGARGVRDLVRRARSRRPCRCASVLVAFGIEG